MLLRRLTELISFFKNLFHRIGDSSDNMRARFLCHASNRIIIFIFIFILTNNFSLGFYFHRCLRETLE